MIVDCIPFFQELDLFYLRLQELDPVVDRFVVVEADLTHAGHPKPLYLAQALHDDPRFEPWLPRIYRYTASLPTTAGLAGCWVREIGQRNAIIQALATVPDDAVVLLSDADEIPRAGHVKVIATAFTDGTLGHGDIVDCDMTLYYYNVNTTGDGARWRGTRITTAATMRALTPDTVRYDHGARGGFPRRILFPHAGWHFSYFGGAAAVQHKMVSFLHQELVTAENTNKETVATRVQAGQDVWGRADVHFTIGPAVDLPLSLVAAPHDWPSFFHPDWQPSYHEVWYPGFEARMMGVHAQQAPADGAILEIGAWEGRSTAVLAQAVAPRIVHVVDHWRGNLDEGTNHVSVRAARERDVFATFQENMRRLTAGNIVVHRADWREWAETWTDPIAFLHLDAAHDYQSVYDCLIWARERAVSGAILCGDDYYADGVKQAVLDALGPAQGDWIRLWLWRNAP